MSLVFGLFGVTRIWTSKTLASGTRKVDPCELFGCFIWGLDQRYPSIQPSIRFMWYSIGECGSDKFWLQMKVSILGNKMIDLIQPSPTKIRPINWNLDLRSSRENGETNMTSAANSSVLPSWMVIQLVGNSLARMPWHYNHVNFSTYTLSDTWAKHYAYAMLIFGNPWMFTLFHFESKNKWYNCDYLSLFLSIRRDFL